MQVMGFDDERVRDEFVADWERRAALAAEELRLVMEWQALLREMVEEIEAGDGVGAWERFGMGVEELVGRLAAAVGPVVEALVGMGEAVLAAVGRVVELVDAVGEARRRPRPRHVNCRCLPVERVDPVRAGRVRWWARR